ncbi:hypothetical protein [Streptomyces sp. SID3343]|uniref:hypothetical protein n=1 Tax=Streptomyces sp. SID3343 TaxID=2690260 RepID=UPI00136FD236|nr:hypothetical protein [Streptomyces sp. SID3343]MYV99072.1 hypothetical protein [Streptomyces sp. SID3343]
MTVLLTLVGTTACGGDSDDGSKSGFIGALDAVRDDASTRAWLEFGDTAAIVKANGGTDRAGPYASLLGMGYTDVATMGEQLPQALGFDPAKSREAWSAGREPDKGGVFVGGFDKGTVTDKLKELGGKPEPSDSNVYRLRADNELGFDDPLAQKLPLGTARFNTVRVSDRQVGYGPGARLANLTHGAKLGADSDARSLGECLDHPLAAVLTDRAGGGETPNGPRIAVGVRGKSGAAGTEVLCVATASKDAAKAEADRLRAVFAGGGTTSSGVAWNVVLTDIRVEVTDRHVVEVTAHPSGPVRTGVFLKALNDMSLGMTFAGRSPGGES